MEEETVILPKKIVDDLKERLEKVEQDNKQLDAKIKQWEANSTTMKDKITRAENENKDKAEELVKLKEALNTPIVAVAQPMTGSEPEQKYNCLLCNENTMNKTNLHIHLQQMHNVNRLFAEIPIVNQEGVEDARRAVTAEEEDQTDSTQEWQTVQHPKRRASSSFGAKAPGDRPSGDRAPSVISPGGRAPGDKVQPVTAQTAQYRQEFPEDRQERETQGKLNCQECSFQTNEERRLNKHIEDIHRITCFTCKDKF